ncbi:MAG: hypothetical protein JSS09_03710 [Verrucomicrobia bacterium]|nr:hypothetical protein [Verrucomicrobiota bacterium]
MLTFLRIHQKTVLVAVTAAVVVSFFFFGASSGGGLGEKVKEQPIGKALDGSTITRQKVDRMVKFLSGSHLDLLDDKVSSPNLLNDGVLEKDFIKTSMGPLLAEKIFPKIEKELSATLQKARSFEPYRHPHSPFLSAGGLWSQFAPDATRVASEIILTNSKVTVETFRLLSELYSHQKSVPLTFFKRMIFYQQNQDSRIQPDEQLSHADLSLFGLHSAKEWFGSTYLEAAAQVIINGASVAKSKGFTLSTAEARAQLLANVEEGFKRSGEKIEPEYLYTAFINQVRKEGMDEVECLDLWKDIALFRKLRASFGEEIFVDPDVIQKAHFDSKDLATIELYSLPASLLFKDFSSLLKLQLYIEAVSNNTQKTKFLLPRETLSLTEIERKMPELIRREYVLEYGELDLKKAASQIGLKEVWAWETGDLGWSSLQNRFSFLSNRKGNTKEARFTILEELEDEKRLEVDSFARQTILSSDQQRLKQAFSSVELKQDSFLVGQKGEGLPFKGASDRQALKALLEKSALKEASSSDKEALAAREKLLFYTDDQQHYYKVFVLERSSLPRVLTFSEAEEFGILRQKLDKRLEDLYLMIRKKDTASYLQKEGSWKPLAEVKDKVGLSLFPDFCLAIQAGYSEFSGKEVSLEQKQAPSFYVQYWALASVKEALEEMKAVNGLDLNRSSLVKQWDLTAETKTLGKSRKDIFSSDVEFFLEPGRFSSIKFSPSGKNLFFKVMSRSERDSLPASELENIKAPLRQEAEKKGMESLLEKIELKGSLYLGDFT